MPSHRDGHRPQFAAGLAFVFGLALCAPSWAGLIDGGPSTCDPTRASCAPGNGSGPGSDCTPAREALGLCQPPGTGNPGMCTPPSNGSPSCGGSGPASQGDGTGVQVGAGNPINLISGNKYQEETDLRALPGALGLELKRYYNSLSSHPGLLGANWRISYETVLFDLGGQIQIVQADGRRLMFQRGMNGNAALCSSATLQDGQVRIEEPRDGTTQRIYLWRWPDGRTLMFSGGSGGGHPLQAITAAGGEQVTLTYSPRGELIQVRDPQGRKLEFIYGSAVDRRSRALKAIDTPLGRVTYTQDKRGRLIEAASSKDAASAPYATRIYHYEDKFNVGHPNALTGISVKGIDSTTGKLVEQRLSTYAYNEAGLAILSTKGAPLQTQEGRPVADTGIEQVQVQYLDKALPFEGRADNASGAVTPRQLGRAVLTNSLGQKTEVLSAVIGGHYRLVQMKGAGCSTCGPTNMRYAYNARGQLLRATKLDDNGQPIFSEVTQHDAYGRVMRVGRQVHGTLVKGGTGPVQWTKRFEYPDVHYQDGSTALAPLPGVIAQPSVIAGKEHVTRIAYNAAWQPLIITDEGFSPIDEKGQPSPQGTPISRSTRYRYVTINGRSLLKEIDGPLPNGPKNVPEDSDLTLIDWDSQGRSIAEVTYPENFRAHIEYDSLGRLAAVTGPSGVTDRYRYDDRGSLASVSHEKGRVVFERESYRHDALGQIIETSSLVGDKDVPRTRQAFDVAGRLAWHADALGILRQAAYDTEDHLLSARVFGGSTEQLEHYAYDLHGRLQRVQDNAGATREIVRDDAGRLVASIDPLGRWTRYARELNGLRATQAANTTKPLVVRYAVDERGQLASIEAEASDGANTVRATRHQRVVDDFGREVMMINPDSGREVRRFDAAGRVVQVLQSDGSTIDFEYDLANRLVRRTATPQGIPAETARPQTVRYVYEASRLAQISDPQQTERYTYDDLDRVIRKTVTLALDGAGEAVSTTSYRYDEQGLLVAQTLPDGSELQYGRNGQRQIVALYRQTTAWAPFGWGRTALVKDIRRDLIGLRSVTYGNGVAGQWQRSREGVLGRVVYTSPRHETSALRTAFESLMADARAQNPQPAQPASAPGAFGLASDPHALWDSRLLFDLAGNIVVQGQFATSAVSRPEQTVLAYDAQDQVAQALQGGSRRVLATGAPQSSLAVWRYHHDSLGNRLLAQETDPSGAMGKTVRAGYVSTTDRRATQPIDEAGRPGQDDQRRYRWDALGRLTSVTREGRTTTYRYNRLGLRVAKRGEDVQQHVLYDDQRHRLAELDAHGRVTREYVWMGDQLVAVIQPQRPLDIKAPPEGVLQSLARTAQVLWANLTGSAPAMAYVHVDHLGAPVAMTDAAARPVWAAKYAPFGQRMDTGARGLVKTSAPETGSRVAGESMRLDLRLPGQWEDEESGLYYNDQRYYDPRAGRYISPDPLGLRGGLNAYAYVGNNPLGFGDPFGLVLFSFDGTGNTDDQAWLRANGSSLSNVRQFWNLYEDGNRRYITGVGTLYHDERYGDIRPEDFSRGTLLGSIPGVSLERADMGGNYSGPARIQRMIQYFNDEADLATDDSVAMEVDIVGFSRGAAEARDFANQIVAHTRNGVYRYTGSDGTQHCQRLDFRFIGLWDTVLSTNRSDYSYNLAIPDQFAYVAQAVALNEYRGDSHHAGFSSFGAFPLESISPGMYSPASTPGRTRIERGFIGAHADIGGGFGENENQLAQVALVWMLQQAQAAGVRMSDPSGLHSIIASPVIHDRSDSILTGAPGPYAEDRQVRYRDGTTTTQRQMMFSSGMSYPHTQQEQLINYFARDPLSPQWQQEQDLFQTGTVDIQRYLGWLNNNGYDIHLTVQ